ncbi:MAG: porin family protein [Verrucomicrobiota bacterium]
MKNPITKTHSSHGGFIETKKRFDALFLSGIAALAIGSANLQAQTETNQYVEIIGGLNSPASTTLDSAVDGGTLSFDTSFDSGIVFGGAYGYEFTESFTGEFEYIWQTTDADQYQVANLPTGGEGDVSAVTIMLNALWDRSFGESDRWSLFGGVGLGFIQEVSSDYEVDGVEYSFDDSGFGFQAMLGIRREINDRWYWSGELKQLFGGSFDAENELDATDIISLDYDVTSLSFGHGYRF